MTEYLGLPLDLVLKDLQKDGFQNIELVEVACKKGSAGDDRRVIKLDRTDEDAIRVFWSSFQTTVTDS